MAADVKHVKMQLDISAAKANAELSKLANKLEKISEFVSEMNEKGLKGFTYFVDNVQWSSSLDWEDIKELSHSLTRMLNTNVTSKMTVVVSSMPGVSTYVYLTKDFMADGHPETGELFQIREKKMNEVVKHIEKNSVLANNAQITEVIRGAVMERIHEDGQNALLREQNTLLRAILEKDTDISLDGRSLVDGIDRARKRMGLSFQPA